MGAAQLYASAESYGRRYQAKAALGIQPRGEDDDGHAAGGTGAETRQHTQKQQTPACPQCGKSEFVYHDEKKGGFFCWKTKGGCGHNWLPTAEGEQHGQKTADQVTTVAIYSYDQIINGLKSIDASDSGAAARLTKYEDLIHDYYKNRKLLDPMQQEHLGFLVAEIQSEINSHKQAAEAVVSTNF
jgi:hypothetical protein